MTAWRPDIELQRLLAALDEDLRAATDDEVREVAAASGHAPARVAGTVRRLVDAAIDAADDPDPRALPVVSAGDGTHHIRRH